MSVQYMFLVKSLLIQVLNSWFHINQDNIHSVIPSDIPKISMALVLLTVQDSHCRVEIAEMHLTDDWSDSLVLIIHGGKNAPAQQS